MLVRQYKNGNIHIKYEPDYDSPFVSKESHPLANLICILANSNELDCIDVDFLDIYSVTLAIVNHTANEVYDYYVSPYTIDSEAFFSGKWVIIRPESKHAFIIVPTFYKTYECEGYTIYYLCENPSDEFKREMEGYGVEFGVTFPAYAPEIRHTCMKVPNSQPVKWGV